MSGCTTDWELERKPGGGWAYDEANMAYNDSLFDGLTIYFDTLGEVTVWTFDDPIDGCNIVPTFLEFQDGTAATFQDGTAIQFN